MYVPAFEQRGTTKMPQEPHQEPSTEATSSRDSTRFDPRTKPGYPPNPKRLTPEEAQRQCDALPESAWEAGEEMARKQGLI
ncbi:hypothetical protein NG895_07015 [Aeoliella sp. ICT_H6.2]|uniref:Uncharacterized protein n=1 Tax=Aeoliella straminimaris TaxID=2954799 RepID=A0A9X2F8K1_9BACT|nr:hypothetical protein [Aeoliella straminimaris]MCO6043653.1 hypothetical protein [Aeoliella straminimaris]